MHVVSELGSGEVQTSTGNNSLQIYDGYVKITSYEWRTCKF